MTTINRWIHAVPLCLVASGLGFAIERGSSAYFVRGSLTTVRPNQPVPIDVGKGIENKLDQLLEAIRSLNAEALKITYVQGILQGALAATLLLTLLIALKAPNK